MRVLIQIHDERLKHSSYAYTSTKAETEDFLLAEVAVEGSRSLVAAALRAAADSLGVS